MLLSELLNMNTSQRQDPGDAEDSGQKSSHALGRAQCEAPHAEED